MKKLPTSPISIFIDENPIHLELSKYSDYSAQQILSLCALPLVHFNEDKLETLAAESWSTNDNFTEFHFTLKNNLRWSDGLPVSSKNYLDSFRKVLENPNNRFSKVLNDLVKNEKAILIGDNKISFYLRQSNSHFPELLSLICFSPYREDAIETNISAGAYFISEKTTDSFYLRQNPYFQTTNESLSAVNTIQFVRLPLGESFGLKYFTESKIQRTCDTAFPYHLKDEYKDSLIEKDEKLLMLFTAGNRYTEHNKDIYQNFFNSIDKTKISKQLFNVLQPRNSILELFGKNPNKPKPSSENIRFKKDLIHIAYENYYPNIEVLELVKAQFQERNLRISFVEEEYGSRSANCHLRLEIRQSPLPSPFLFLRSWVSNRVFAEQSGLFKEALGLFSKYQVNKDSQALIDLDNLLRKDLTSYPLFQIPSLYLQDPILSTNNTFQPGHMWNYNDLT